MNATCALWVCRSANSLFLLVGMLRPLTFKERSVKSEFVDVTVRIYSLGPYIRSASIMQAAAGTIQALREHRSSKVRDRK